MAEYIWALALNPIRGQAEERTPVARADTREALERFLEREKVEPYDNIGDNINFPGQPYTYRKVFRKDGPLEWFNWPMQSEPVGNHFQEVPSEEFWMNTAQQEWENKIGRLPHVS